MARDYATDTARPVSYCDRQVRRWLVELGPVERGGCGLLEWCHQRPRLRDGVVQWRTNVYRPTVPAYLAERVAESQRKGRARSGRPDRRNRRANNPGGSGGQGGGGAGGQRVLERDEIEASQRAGEAAAGLAPDPAGQVDEAIAAAVVAGERAAAEAIAVARDALRKARPANGPP